jgi:hypothetical protein
VVLHNEGSGPRTVELIVTRRDGESPGIDTALELDPNSRGTINNEVVVEDDYDVAVTVTGPTGNAPYTGTQGWSGAGQPLHVILTDQIVFAVEIGRLGDAIPARTGPIPGVLDGGIGSDGSDGSDGSLGSPTHERRRRSLSERFLHRPVGDARVHELLADDLVPQPLVEADDGHLRGEPDPIVAGLAGVFLDGSHDPLAPALLPAGFADRHPFDLRDPVAVVPETGSSDGLAVRPGEEVCRLAVQPVELQVLRDVLLLDEHLAADLEGGREGRVRGDAGDGPGGRSGPLGGVVAHTGTTRPTVIPPAVRASPITV